MKNKIVCFSFCVLLFSLSAFGQLPMQLLAAIKKSRPDTGRVSLLLKAGDFYRTVREDDYNLKDLKNAAVYYDMARQLSLKLNNMQLWVFASEQLASTYASSNNWASGKLLGKQVINYYQKTGDLNDEAAAWVFLARLFPYGTSAQVQQDKLQMYDYAYVIYKKLNDKQALAYLLLKKGNFQINIGNLDLAEKELLETLGRYQSLHVNKLYPTYEALAQLYKMKGNLSRQLFYILKMLENFELYGSKSEGCNIYYKAAGFYADWEMYRKAFYWSKRSVEADEQYAGFGGYYDFVRSTTDILLLQNKNQDALNFVQRCRKKHASPLQVDAMEFNEAFGNCYLALGQFQKAGSYYRKAQENYKHTDVLKSLPYSFEYIYLQKKLGEFYFKTRQFQKSAFYLDKIELIPTTHVKPAVVSSIHLSIFKTDSALRKYIPAIRNFEVYKKIRDSIFTVRKSSQIAEMQTKYETLRKEESIKLLESKSRMQQAKLQSLDRERDATLAGIAMLLVTVGIALYSYRNKRQSNQLLKAKQKEINGQNQLLQGLLFEKESLLSDKDTLINDKDVLLLEKDRLLKEVQHRVRNNLQIVMSLLNTQSAFLKNSDAKTAIRESQNRVQSISLIHQKLYNSGTSSSIVINTYINEMLLYLRDSYATDKHRIRIVQTVDDVILDITQAVPLGLILNESVTNAIKYAFGPEGGELFVVFQRTDHENLRLTVADHGPGMPEDVAVKNIKSLGLEMIRILSKQLNGIFTIKNTPGVMITVEFPEEKMIHSIDL